jgi:indolepyruvate ferredoxin oxidoreductase beta subunit
MSVPRLWTLLIPAVGGQGGGVLSEWIVEAATIEGLLAHGTSIPGVAQRTGSTTYYVELHDGAELPAFSLYPVPGALDVLLAPELLEVGRMIELGFPSPARTTIVASTHRLYSIHEKTTTSGRTYPTTDLLRAAREFSRTFVALDALALARAHGTEANAILLGALAGSGALPVSAASYRAAIERKGIQRRANLAGFEIGLAQARAGGPANGNGRMPVDTNAGETWRSAAGSREAVDALIAGLPEPVRAVARHAVPRLIEYQDRAYADRYLARLSPFLAPGADADLAALVARLLAVWMTYEDAIRVAELKTRASRFDRIRRDMRAGDAEIVVTDYLKPDLDELYGILPHRLVHRFARWAERRWPGGRPTVGQRVNTTTVSGYLRVWLLSRLRRFRPGSHRAHGEHARMERWLEATRRAADWDVALAHEIARAAGLVKGYGAVRRRMFAMLEELLETVTRITERDRPSGRPAGPARAFARRYRELVLEGPDGEAKAMALAASTTAGADAGDVGELAAR